MSVNFTAFKTLINKIQNNSSDRDIERSIGYVSEFWNYPEHKLFRESVVSSDEFTVSQAKMLASFNSPSFDYKNKGFEFDHLVAKAEKNPIYFETLKDVVASWLEQEQTPKKIKDTAIKIIQGHFKPNKRFMKKSTPAMLGEKYQLAAAVAALHTYQNSSISKSGMESQNNAFFIVSEAVKAKKVGERTITAHTVADAWKIHKDAFDFIK